MDDIGVMFTATNDKHVSFPLSSFFDNPMFYVRNSRYPFQSSHTLADSYSFLNSVGVSK